MARGISDHPDFDQLLRRVAALVAHAGRWNPPSSFATVYAAFSDATALAESKAHFL